MKNYRESFPDGFVVQYYILPDGRCNAFIYDNTKELVGHSMFPRESLVAARNNAHWCYHSRTKHRTGG